MTPLGTTAAAAWGRNCMTVFIASVDVPAMGTRDIALAVWCAVSHLRFLVSSTISLYAAGLSGDTTSPTRTA